MLKKVWFIFVLCSVLMVSGCSGKQTEDMECNVVSKVESSEMDAAEDLEADIDEMENLDVSMETEKIERAETEEQSGDVSNSEASTTEESVVNDTTKDAEPSTTEAPSEPENVVTQPTTPPAETQPITPEQITPSTEAPATETDMPSATDDRGNPADGSPVFEITFNIPQAEYVGYKEKVEWLEIADCSVQDAIQRFISKLDSIGVVYRYSGDMLDEFMRLESVVAQMKREQCVGKGERSR